MHAASVNPEPGSNSLKNVYLNSQGEPKSFFRANFNLSFSLLLFRVLLFVFDKIAQLVLKSLLVLFNFQ